MTTLWFLSQVVTPPGGEDLGRQIVWLFVLAIPVACMAWTVTHEEVFREGRDYCIRQSKECKAIYSRKFYYLFTCEYCFSHWVTLLILILTGFRLLLDNWVGYVLSFFAVVLVSNIYMSLYNRLRVDIRSERAEAELKEQKRME